MGILYQIKKNRKYDPMHFSEQDKTRIVSFYHPLINEYGTQDARAEGWSNDYNKLIRFQVLAGIAYLEGQSILDVGCGFGDLYEFLSKHLRKFEYHGIDINPEMIEKAQKKYPDVEFLVADFGECNGKKFDYALSSGAMSFKIADYKEIYFGYIKKMFEISEKGVAFNMLNQEYHVDDDIYAAYSIKEVSDYCGSLADKIIVRQDYLDHDFTVYLYH